MKSFYSCLFLMGARHNVPLSLMQWYSDAVAERGKTYRQFKIFIYRLHNAMFWCIHSLQLKLY